MKHLLTSAAFSLAALPAFADTTALGTWKTQSEQGGYAHVRMYQCGANICGKIARTFDTSGEIATPVIGQTIIMDMVPTGAGRFEGKLRRPESKKTYRGKIEVNGSTLTLKGCVAGGAICIGQTWKRVN